MEKRKIFVLATALIAFVVLSGAAVYHAMRTPDSLVLNTQGQPTIGAGKVEMVLIEDFRCTNCRTFSEEVLPEIANRYIHQGRVRFTIVPIAFIEGSKPLANAALAVYHQAPNRFFAFAQKLFEMDAADKSSILRAARRVGDINLETLSRAIDNRLYYDELEFNYHWAKKLMGKQFGTPALYVNGIPTSTASLDIVARRIEQLEKQ